MSTSPRAASDRRTRDRRGRGMRGPAIAPALPGRPELPTRGQRFDELVLETVRDIDTRWQDRLGLVEYAVEDTPQLPDDWSGETVPLASLVRGHGTTPTRLVVFRRPIEHRCETRAELEAMVLMVLVEQVAELLGIDAEDVDPRYSRDD
ncbi:MAG TPA: metallopeptidase family protein [Nocardioides sp.]|nr:metallopeptidase family protein [Nocardioides sp.]